MIARLLGVCPGALMMNAPATAAGRASGTPAAAKAVLRQAQADQGACLATQEIRGPSAREVWRIGMGTR